MIRMIGYSLLILLLPLIGAVFGFVLGVVLMVHLILFIFGFGGILNARLWPGKGGVQT